VCTFCSKTAGVFTCPTCKGKPKFWLNVPNFEKLWKWHDPHYQVRVS
jgi:hypothetical protein